MADLSTRIEAVIRERLAVARAATQGSWRWVRREEEGFGDQGPWLESADEPYVLSAWGHDPAYGLSVEDTDKAHIALNDPTDAILGLEHALGILQRHTPETFAGSTLPEQLDIDPDEPWCRVCRGAGWPCTEVSALATRYAVEIDESSINPGGER